MCVCCDVTCVREWLSVCVCVKVVVCCFYCYAILCHAFSAQFLPFAPFYLLRNGFCHQFYYCRLYIYFFSVFDARVYFVYIRTNGRKLYEFFLCVCVCLGFVIIIVVVLLFSCFTNTLPKTKEKENEEEEEKNITRDTTTAHVNRKCSFSMGNHFVCHCHTTDPNEIDNKKF